MTRTAILAIRPCLAAFSGSRSRTFGRCRGLHAIGGHSRLRLTRTRTATVTLTRAALTLTLTSALALAARRTLAAFLGRTARAPDLDHLGLGWLGVSGDSSNLS